MTTIDLTGAQWRKSSHSGADNGCVEVANAWRKSSHSNDSGACVEVGRTQARVVAVRDTTDRDGGIITVTPAAWEAFTSGVRDGRAVRNPVQE